MLRPSLVRIATAASLAVGLLSVGPAGARAQSPTPSNDLTVQTIAPITVNPHRLGSHPTPIYQDVDGDVPPELGGGVPTGGLPSITPDTGRGTAALSPVPHTSTGIFAVLADWSGARFDNTCNPQPSGCFGSEPPDTQMATGVHEVVEAVNNNIFVFSRGGTQLDTYAVSAVFQPQCNPACTSVGYTDPKILFDASTGLYYMTEMVCPGGGCGGNSWSDMGISLAVTSDPTSSWTLYDRINDGQDLQDQEKLGFSGDKITFAVNEYGCKCGAGSSFKQENVAVIQKSEAIASATIHWVVNSTLKSNATNGFVFDSMPTTPINSSTSDNTQYVVWDAQFTSSNYMAVIRITGTPNGGDLNFLSTDNKPSIANQTAPPAPVQSGGTFAGDKQNFQSAMVQGNDLWTVATDGCTPTYPTTDTQTRACTRLVEVNLSGGGASVVTDTDIGDTGTYRVNPSVTKDTDGHVFFGFTLSSSTIFPTASIDGTTTPFPSVLQRADLNVGDRTYSGGRWGDYSGTQQDPVDTHDVWTAQEYGACDTACGNYNYGGNWATELAQVTYQGPSITSVSPSGGPATGGTTVDIYGSEFASGASVLFASDASPTVTFLNSTHLQAVSPAEDSGTVDITTSTAAGSTATTVADQFDFSPVLTSISPTNGPAQGGDTVHIYGAGLNAVSGVDFGGTPAQSYSYVSSSEVTAVTPAHAGGSVSVTVTTGGGVSNGVTYTFQFATTTSLGSSVSPSAVGQSVTFTATVSPVPDGGTISFSDNGSPIGTCQLLLVNTSTGRAACTVTYGAVGSHSVVASYSGDFNFESSGSSTLTQRVTYVIQILFDQSKLQNRGSSVPVKVALQDFAGNNISSPSIVVTVTGLSPSPAPGIPPSGNFTYMLLGTGPGYQLNVKTSNYPSTTYTLSFSVAADPVVHTVQFGIR